MPASQQILQIARVDDQKRTRALIRFDEHHAIANVDTQNLMWDPIIVPPERYCPEAPRGIHIALAEVPSYCYIKYPRLELWQPGWRIVHQAILKKKFLREAKVCEVLRQKPHYNVATYHGCIVKGDLIRGICYSRYWKTLEDLVNPGRSCGKRSFRYGGVRLRDKDKFFRELMSGVAHLHSLGFVHNDLKPLNIMVREEDESPVIIDFDSCILVDEPLSKVPRTRGWHDPSVRDAAFTNDLHAVQEIRMWLSEGKVKTWRFDNHWG